MNILVRNVKVVGRGSELMLQKLTNWLVKKFGDTVYMDEGTSIKFLQEIKDDNCELIFVWGIEAKSGKKYKVVLVEDE